jgi:predicted nucleotidyltransferase
MTSFTATDSALLQVIAGGIERALAATAIGAYLHGSTGLQQLRPGSDLDVMVVASAPLTPEQRVEVTDLMLDVSGRRARIGEPARPVELTVVTQEEVRPWQFPPRCDFQYGEWLRDEIVGGSGLQPFTNADLALLVTSVLACDMTLFGPPVSEVLDPVPRRDLVAATVSGIPGLLEDLSSDTTNVLLTLARAWRTVVTQDIVPKDIAAQWAIARLPTDDQPALDHATGIYLGEEDERWESFRVQLPTVASHLVANIGDAGA